MKYRLYGHQEPVGGSFIPNPLPPSNPPFTLNSQLTNLYGTTMLRLGELNEMSLRLPNLHRFIKAYVIKEALLSSEIEGIHTTLLDVFTHPFSSLKPKKETLLILNYTKALNAALESKLPISNRFILTIHKTLMQSTSHADPGNYRKVAVRVGDLIPPRADKIMDLMADLECFINEDQSLPALIKAGLAHVQFETIHPFLDGNGRVGRLLIVLMLMESGLLKEPILYPSYYFKKHRLAYYQHLDKVRSEGDFEGWIEFFLTAIAASSEDAYQKAKAIEKLENDIQKTIHTNNKFYKKQLLANHAIQLLFQYPIIGVGDLAKHLNKTYNTTHHLINHFTQLGWLSEITEQKRNKLYRFAPYLKLLDQ